MPRLIDLTGKKFGNFTVVSLSSNRNRRVHWRCLCACGKGKDVSGSALRSGNTKSCGCLKAELISKAHTKHGMAGTRLYIIWKHMTQRCENQNVERYKSYGGRGIAVCKEWRENPVNFINWAMENGYNDTLSIDRIDVNGDYEPKNCRWIPVKKQAQNRRGNVNITINNESRCLSEWACISGIPYETLRSRIKSGVPLEKLLLKEIV